MSVYLLVFFLINYISCWELNPNSKLTTINNGLGLISLSDNNFYNLTIQINNQIYPTTISSEYPYTYETYFTLSTDDFYPIILLPLNLTLPYLVNNIYYQNTNQNSIQVSSGNTDAISSDLIITTTSIWIISAGIITGFFAVLFIYLSLKYHRTKTIEILYRIDHLYIKTFEDVPISDETENTQTLPIGVGYATMDRTSWYGGALTIIVSIIAIFAMASYFYETYSNNTTQTTSFTINNGYDIPIQNSFISVQISFDGLFYSPCDSSWQLSVQNLPYSNPTITETGSNCTLSYQCQNCAVDIDNDAIILLSQTGYYSAYESLSYIVTTNSYTSTSSIYGSISTDQVFTGSNSISLSTNPTIYQDTTSDLITLVGYVLDYQNTFLGATTNLTQYVDQVNQNNTIGASVKITRNTNWLNIILSTKYSGLIIFSQIVSIFGGVYSISSIVMNIIFSKTVREIGYDLFKKGKDKTIIDTYRKIKNLNQEIDIKLKLQSKYMIHDEV